MKIANDHILTLIVLVAIDFSNNAMLFNLDNQLQPLLKCIYANVVVEKAHFTEPTL